EEQCCDACVVWAQGGEGKPYAEALLQAVTFLSGARAPMPVAASGVGPVTHLRKETNHDHAGKYVPVAVVGRVSGGGRPRPLAAPDNSTGSAIAARACQSRAAQRCP